MLVGRENEEPIRSRKLKAQDGRALKLADLKVTEAHALKPTKSFDRAAS
jgi:hypothetical protein